ncbi:hypothetical protein LDENG_00074550 [Lucifuga dentata]|nr:hypothetical protein LDENG_00074550 [Lucifuga dentata]
MVRMTASRERSLEIPGWYQLKIKGSQDITSSHATVGIVVKDNPPRPTLNPETLEVKEGTSVKLTCSAAAPCPSHPPTLTWTPSLGAIKETLQENQNETKSMISMLTFNAAFLHHRKSISCTANYDEQAGKFG